MKTTRLNYQNIIPALQEAGLLQAKTPVELSEGSGGLQVDSRKVQPGDIFITWTQYEAQARERGAKLVIGSTADCDIQVSCGRSAWAWLCSAAYGHSHRQLKILGITGTNGKTSTAWITSTLLRHAGHDVLTIGTLGAFFDEKKRTPLHHTTPDPDVLYPLLDEAVQKKAFVVMEVSSHSIAQKKIEPLSFFAAAMTSFSQDHLDFHGTMENYWNTKWGFVKKAKHVALFDDLPGKLDGALRYGSASSADLTLHRSTQGQLCLTARDFKGEGFIPWAGAFAEQNFAAAWLLARFVGVTLTPEFWKGSCIPGRMEKIHTAPHVFIDYAHTPDALKQTLLSLKPEQYGRLLVMFGCGGDRDQSKRPLMGQIATQYADIIILTSDNPRSEDPEKILHDIAAGCTKPVTRITDRLEAIHHILHQAKPHDIVVIAGKGHETTQDVQGVKNPFNDSLIVQSYFKTGETPCSSLGPTTSKG